MAVWFIVNYFKETSLKKICCSNSTILGNYYSSISVTINVLDIHFTMIKKYNQNLSKLNILKEHHKY
jgi:hypothetical protein